MSTVEQQIREAIQEAIADNEVILFMKGTPEAPR
jgi:glutaredoxin-related protein